MALTTITSKGQVTIPKNIRDLLHLYAGDKVEFVFNESNDIIMRPITKKVAEVCGGLAQYKLQESISVDDMNKAIKTTMRKKYHEST